MEEIKVKNNDSTSKDYNKTDTTLFVFDEETQDAVGCIKSLNEFQVENHDDGQDFKFVLDIKDLPFETKRDVLKYALTTDNIIDTTLILNIFLLIKGYNTFDDRFFESRQVCMKSLEEFIDLKLALKDELNAFINNLKKWYYSVITCCGLVEYVSDDKPQIMPYTYQRILGVSDFVSLSNIFKKTKKLEEIELVTVGNAHEILLELAKRFVLSDLIAIKSGAK